MLNYSLLEYLILNKKFMNGNYIKSLSIIFPFFNEDKRILKIIKKIKFLIYKFKNFDLEIILVNDGSTDKSLEFIKKN